MRRLLCLLLCLVIGAQSNSEDDATAEAYREKFRQALQAANISGSTVSANSVEVQDVGVPDFDCELDATKPTSIHDLSPMYVDVVGAMGDSVTAAFGAGAKTIFGALTEYRGLSWSIGGDKDLTEIATLPNVVRKFNPDLQGFSINTGNHNSPNARMNVAISGAVCSGMLGQAKTLVDKMATEGFTDEDWKVVTLWIGGNDLCAIKSDEKSPEELARNYVDYVEAALDHLHENLRRTFVNLVEMIDVSDLHQVTGLECFLVHEFACKSIKSEALRNKVSVTSNLYNDYLGDLINSGKYDNRDDFTVVLQPFFSETPVPLKENGSADKSYFALDCFHFSQKGHAVGAKYLWNNMFEPLGKKTDHIDWYNMEPLMCPADFPYFATSKNSLNRGGAGLLQAGSDDQGSPHSANLLGILVGTGVGVFLVAMAATVVVVVMVRRRSRVTGPTEKMQLLSFKS